MLNSLYGIDYKASAKHIKVEKVGNRLLNWCNYQYDIILLSLCGRVYESKSDQLHFHFTFTSVEGNAQFCAPRCTGACIV